MARDKRRLLGSTAPPRSLYRKIQIVLLEVRKRPNVPLKTLVEQIISRGHLDFTRYKAEPEHSSSLVPCSGESILGVMQICEQLGLIDLSKTELTPSGVRAADSRFFDEVIKKAVPVTLGKLGTPMKQVRKAIIEMLAGSNKDLLPTAEAIHRRLGSPGGAASRDDFKRYLSLLGLCNGISFSRKKIYLP